MMSFLTCLEEGIAWFSFRLRCCMGGGCSLVLRGLAFSQERMMRVWVVSLVGFVFAIASALRDFLYLKLYATWYFFHDSCTS